MVDNDNSGLDVGEVAGAEHEAKEGGSVERVVDHGDGDSEEDEALGVEAVKLAFIAEAHDDGLGARERRECIMVRELKDQATEAGGVKEVRGVGVGEPSFFSFAVVKEGEKLVIVGSEEVVAVARWMGESGGCKRVIFMMVVPPFGISLFNYLPSHLVIQTRNFNNERILIKAIKIFKI